MNLLGTQNIQTETKGKKPSGDVLDVLGAQLQLDPEALLLLQEGGHLKGMSFEHILAASEDGKSTDEIIAMLSAKGGEFEESVEGNKDQLNQINQNILAKNLKSEGATPGQEVQVPQQMPSTEASEIKNIIQGNPQVQNTSEEIVSGQLVGKQQIQNMLDVLTQKPMTSKQVTSQVGMQVDQGLSSQVQDSDSVLALRQAMKDQIASNPSESGNKLLKLNEFMETQSPAMKRNAGKKAYKPVSDSMFAQKVEQTIPGVTKAPTKEVTLQDIMLGQNMEQDSNSQPENLANMKSKSILQANTQQSKVLDISTLTNTNKIDDVINQIQNYVLRSTAANQKEVSMSFQHRDLGQVDLFVQKAANNHLNIGINTNSVEGAKFFNQNQGDLLQTLQQSGLNIKEMKLDGASTSNNQSFAQNESSRQGTGGQARNGQHQSQSGQRQEESSKRQELWNYYQDKEAA